MKERTQKKTPNTLPIGSDEYEKIGPGSKFHDAADSPLS